MIFGKFKRRRRGRARAAPYEEVRRPLAEGENPRLRAAGPVLTAGELRESLATLGGDVVALKIGFSDDAGFDSFIAVREIVLLRGGPYGGGELHLTGRTYHGEGAPGAREVTYRDLPAGVEMRAWNPRAAGGPARALAEALAEAGDGAPVYLALCRAGVISPRGRHFLVPATVAGPLVMVSLRRGPGGAADDQGADKGEVRERRMLVGVLDVHGDAG